MALLRGLHKSHESDKQRRKQEERWRKEHLAQQKRVLKHGPVRTTSHKGKQISVPLLDYLSGDFENSPFDTANPHL